MKFAKENPQIPEGINYSREHPLKEFTGLFLGVILVLGITVALLGYFAQVLSPYIPFRYELNLVEDYLPKSRRETTASFEFVQAEEALVELGSRLSRNMELEPEMQLTFHLMDAPEVPNAFATLGGHVFVTTGLLKQVSSENALAMVVAHEIAHVKHRHPIQALSRGVIVQIVLSLIAGRDTSALQGVVGQTGLLTLLSFNRTMEHEADAEAVAAMIRVYGHLGGASEFFQKMHKAGFSAGWREVFETHPDVSERIKNIELASVNLSAAELVPLDGRFSALVHALDSGD